MASFKPAQPHGECERTIDIVLISYNSNFKLANEIPLPWGRNFSLIPWSGPLFARMGGVGAKF